MLRRQSRKSQSSPAFTLFEILAVLLLLSIGFAVAITSFSTSKSTLRRAQYQLTQDVQGLYLEAIKNSTIYQLRFPADKTYTYQIAVYEPPMKKPAEDDREAMEKWEEHQRAIEALSADERKKRTRLDRGQFKVLKEKSLPGDVEIEKILKANVIEDEEKRPTLFFYPSGDMDQMLLVLKVNEELKTSLLTDPLTGKVLIRSGELSEQEWKKETSQE